MFPFFYSKTELRRPFRANTFINCRVVLNAARNMVRLVMKDEAESKTAPINNGCLNGDKKKTHYRIGDQAARLEMRSLQFSLHGRNPNADIVSRIQLARRIRGVQA